MYFFKYYHSRRNWDSSGGIITRLQAGLSGVRIPAGGREFPPPSPPLQNIQNSSGAQTASYSVSTSGRFPGSKAAGARG
jgi:hypothetical protein